MGHSPGFSKIVEETRARVRETDAATIKARLEKGERFHLIDVREDAEWAAGRIKGAAHLGRGVLERDVEAAIPERSAEIVLYCGGGFRSVLAAESLGKMGYTNVLSMDGGWRAWLEIGGATEK